MNDVFKDMQVKVVAIIFLTCPLTSVRCGRK